MSGAYTVVRSPWEVLGVERECNIDEAKAAYRRLALELHPDKTNGKTATRFAELQKAWEVHPMIITILLRLPFILTLRTLLTLSILLTLSTPQALITLIRLLETQWLQRHGEERSGTERCRHKR
jgi:hypothetical protein